MIRFVRRYKYTITTALVLAGLLAWCAWDGDWWRLARGAAGGFGGAAYILVSDQVRRWNRRRRRVAHGRR